MVGKWDWCQRWHDVG